MELLIPFANTGEKEDFSTTTDPTGKVSLEKGFTELYELKPEEGGLFILRKVFNQMMNLVTTDTVNWKTQTFPNWISNKGDGLPYAYPANAIVKHMGDNWVSLDNDNTEEPSTGSLWVTLNNYFKLNINVLPDKTTPIDTDNLAIQETGSTGALKKLSWINLKATLKAYFDTLYPAVSGYPAFSASKTGQTFTANTVTKLACNVEAYDNTSAYDNATNFRFQPTKAGKYRITVQMQSASAYSGASIYAYKNGVNFSRLQGTLANPYTDTVSGSITLELNGTTDYVEAYGSWTSNNTANAIFQAEYIVGI